MTIRPILCWLAFLHCGAVYARSFEDKEHHLGPTGLFGVTSPTDIRVTKVEQGSPADGKIKEGDVIVAVSGGKFKANTRMVLADAIDKAETEQAKGILTLDLNDGRKVDLQLKVLGAYSATAPYQCPKTDAIITRVAEAIIRSKEFAAHGVPIDLLGLLATGEPKYVGVVQDVIHSAPWASPDLKLDLANSGVWGWGYTNLLLAEYYLLTKDEFVLPALKTYSVALAEGRDAAGLWGHRVANPETNRGQLHGRLPGYAVMNQSSLPCFLSLMLADKCGIKHPEVQAAIEQTHGFYTDFIGKGTLPYGVHDPKPNSFNNNGMSGLAAVAFAIHANKGGAAFFSRMSAAASNTLETGHTGHYFNQMWTGLGAAVAGPEVSSEFFRETRWLHTLNRTWDGNFTYDGAEGKEGEFSYRGLSDAGSHLLNYCLARRKLFITGRDADRSIWLKGKNANDAIALATLNVESKSDKELLDFLGHPMPKVRADAVAALRSRKHDLIGPIKTMLTHGTPIQRKGAGEYFGYGCPKDQLALARDELVSIMRDTKEKMVARADAACALCGLGEDAYPYFNDILALVMAAKPDDPRGKIDERLGAGLNTLCKDPFAEGLAMKDKKLFYAVAHKLMDHKRTSGRIAGTALIAKVPLEDFHLAADKIQYIIDDKDLTYQSYHNLGAKTNCIAILANLNIKGGIEAAFATLDDPNGKAGFKIRLIMDVLPRYGAHARYVLPKIKGNEVGKFQKQWEKMVEDIENAPPPSHEMLTMEEAKQYGLKKTN
ncbi:MAG: DUF6288 domain-containing protein [Akkermansiaceae bacterium]|nr:DUF6288 domain-containing protein [Akkermansiaceae bacterium]